MSKSRAFSLVHVQISKLQSSPVTVLFFKLSSYFLSHHRALVTILCHKVTNSIRESENNFKKQKHPLPHFHTVSQL